MCTYGNWMKEDDNTTQYAICPLSYKAISVPGHNRTGGVIAIMFTDTVSVKCESVYKFESMECVIFEVAPSVSEADKHLIVIYRPPDTNVINFLKDLTTTIKGNGNAIRGHHTSWWL